MEGIKSKKCVVVGDGECGKKKFLQHVCDQKFDDDFVSISDGQIYNSTVLYNNETVNLKLFDTDGCEIFDRRRPLTYVNAKVFIVMFSIVDPSGLENVKTKWFPELEEKNSGVPIVLVGAKNEKRDDTQVLGEGEKLATREEGEKVAREIKAVEYHEINMETKKGMKEVLQTVVKVVLDDKKNKETNFFKRILSFVNSCLPL